MYTGIAIVGEAGTYAAVEVESTIELISQTECIITCAPVGQQGAYKPTYMVEGDILTIGEECVSSNPSGLEACYAAIYVKQFVMDSEAMTFAHYSSED